MSDLQLLELHVHALFTHDRNGRIREINEPRGDPAPRFFLARGRTGNLWRLRHDLPEETARRIDELAAAEPVGDDLSREPRNVHAFLALLAEVGEMPLVDSGPAYRFPDELPASHGVTRLMPSHLHLLRSMISDPERTVREWAEREPWVGVIEDGIVVSVAYSARLTDPAAEAGVETLAAYRGRGHATAVVAEWARAVRATGRVPLYSTSWDNLASQAVARKLGLVHYGTDLSLG